MGALDSRCLTARRPIFERRFSDPAWFGTAVAVPVHRSHRVNEPSRARGDASSPGGGWGGTVDRLPHRPN